MRVGILWVCQEEKLPETRPEKLPEAATWRESTKGEANAKKSVKPSNGGEDRSSTHSFEFLNPPTPDTLSTSGVCSCRNQ